MQLFWNDELLDLCGTFKRLNGKHCHTPCYQTAQPGAMVVPVCALRKDLLLLTGAGASATCAGCAPGARAQLQSLQLALTVAV